MTKKVRVRDLTLMTDISGRIKTLVGDDTYDSVSQELQIKPNTLWSYTHAVCMPSVEVLVKIARHFGKTLDWLVLGAPSEIPKDDREIRILSLMREAEELEIDVSLYEDYIKFLIEREKSKKNMAGSSAPLAKEPGQSDHETIEEKPMDKEEANSAKP